MAPRNKFTREEMIEAALRVVQKKGSSALTARAIADELGVSTQPIFTCFNTMEEAQCGKEEVSQLCFRGTSGTNPLFCFWNAIH